MNENNFSTQRRPHLTKEQRLPKCYKEVEKVINSVKSCHSNIKTALANSRFRGYNHRKLYKLTLNVLKHYNYIQKIINETQLLEKEKFLRKEIASILIYELIFGNGNLPGESKVVVTIRSYKNDILNMHQMLQSNNTDIFAVKEIYVPRYVRVHTLVTTVPYVIKDLENYGFKQIFYDGLSEEKYLELVRSLEQGTFLVDLHFKDVLVFAPEENLIGLDLYENGHIFLQDKASYIPVHVLSPGPGCTVLDACAAPGMKSIHIASKMKNKGILIASERDENRFETLKEMLKYGSVKNAKVLCTDFKLIDPNDEAYSTVEYILLDPSCSGSGMVNRMDEITDTEDSKNIERLKKLSGFQIILLKHALRFPSVKRVVYSTCSIHEEENEYVVHEALNAFSDAFKLVPVLPDWPDRGSENYEYGKLCLRTIPEKHLTNGFFVAMFERIDYYDNGRGKHSSIIYKKNQVNVRGSFNVCDEKVNPQFKKEEKKSASILEKDCEKKKMDETSTGYSISDKHKHKEDLLSACKEKKYDSQQFIGYEKNYDNFQPSKHYKSCNSDTIEVSHKTSESYKNFNQNAEDKQIEDELHNSYNTEKSIEHKTSEFTKNKKKKKEKRHAVGTQFKPNELKQEEFSNCMFSESLQNSINMKKVEKCISPSKIYDAVGENTNVPIGEKKSKRKRHLSLQNESEINAEIPVDMLKHKKKKRKKEHSRDEDILSFTETQDIKAENQMDLLVSKSAKKKMTNEFIHPVNVKSEYCENKSHKMAEDLPETSVKDKKSKKHKKHSKNSDFTDSEFNSYSLITNPSEHQNKSPNYPSVKMVENSNVLQNEEKEFEVNMKNEQCIGDNSFKYKKVKKHSDEFVSSRETLIGDYSDSHNGDTNCIPSIEVNEVRNEKVLSGKTLTYTSVQNDSEIIKKVKKKKRKKYENDFEKIEKNKKKKSKKYENEKTDILSR